MQRRMLIGGTGGADHNSILGLRPRPYDGKIAGLYDLEETLGRGHFAVVKLARHVFTGEKVAVKVIDKSKLDEVSKAHLFQEVRCMKLVQHPHVVRLYEVIDTATKLYLILELGDGGDLYEYILRHDSGLPEEVAREYFAQIVRAISYCHQLHVVHRDLKPENVVFFKKLGIVKLTDFGFSNKFYPGQKLETSCGSLAYSAPEILLGDSYDAPAVDVWSLGVILFMLVCGQPPFQEANDSETLTMIMDCKYIIPPHVSDICRDLISRMLVRNPDKRATLKEIANHQWLKLNKTDTNTDNLTLPLVSREHLSEEDHNFIVQKIVNGNIATKEEIQECLDKNEYNHITATYYLLAERKLRAKRQDVVKISNKRPEHLAVKNATPKKENNGSILPAPCLLNVPRTPGDLPQRARKCSIVQEDDEEEDISSCSGREDLGSSFNRRGSRSEGRLNLALQERLAELERRKPSEKLVKNDKVGEVKLVNKSKEKWQNNTNQQNPVPVTTIITDSSTISIPILTTNSASETTGIPKYKTMPSPTRNIVLPLNEIFEEGEHSTERQPTSRQFVKRTPYEQRKSKFHKTRTASCSSSDASDDDSEKRKKRAHKLSTTPTKPIKGRRDSYDDSSDSQEPGAGTGAGGGTAQRLGGTSTVTIQENNTGGGGTQENKNGGGTGSNNNGGGRKNTSNMLGRRHKASRRRNGETRLRESQSLNRITEVQEDGAHTLVISTTVVGTHGTLTPKVKGIGARILQGFSMTMKRSQNTTDNSDKSSHISRKDTVSLKSPDSVDSNNKKDISDTKKKMKILGKYFYVRKKLCIPLPGLFNNKNRLYKAQSCGSLSRDKINRNDVKPNDTVRCRQRAVSVFPTVVQLNDVCNELTGICAIHLGQTSKCSFC